MVYLGFGYEAISTPANRALLMQRALNWLNPDLTGVPGDPAPVALRLEQNLPNPFNPKTTIRFNLPSAGEAKLLVFDANGRRVATLVDGPQTAGPQEVVWEGRDDAGNTLATGMYFYRLQSAAGGADPQDAAPQVGRSLVSSRAQRARATRKRAR